MTRAQRKAMFSESGGYSIQVLIEISHEASGYPSPIRLVNNTVNLEYNRQTYLAYPFRYNPPDIGEGGEVQNARLIISTLDQQIAAIIRSTDKKPSVKAVAMFYQDGDSLIFEPIAQWELEVKSVSGSGETISAELVYESDLDLEIPGDEFRPVTWPGVF